MNKRLKKKAEKNARKKIHDLLDVVLDINGLSGRKQDITGTLPTAFFEFCGHIGQVEFSVYNEGWFPGATANFNRYVDLSPEKIGREISRLKERHGSRK